jgi:hypothetical protein
VIQKVSLNLKPILERKSEIRLDSSFPKIRKDKREDVPYWEKSHNLSMLMGLLEKRGGEDCG